MKNAIFGMVGLVAAMLSAHVLADQQSDAIAQYNSTEVPYKVVFTGGVYNPSSGQYDVTRQEWTNSAVNTYAKNPLAKPENGPLHVRNNVTKTGSIQYIRFSLQTNNWMNGQGGHIAILGHSFFPIYTANGQFDARGNQYVGLGPAIWTHYTETYGVEHTCGVVGETYRAIYPPGTTDFSNIAQSVGHTPSSCVPFLSDDRQYNVEMLIGDNAGKYWVRDAFGQVIDVFYFNRTKDDSPTNSMYLNSSGYAFLLLCKGENGACRERSPFTVTFDNIMVGWNNDASRLAANEGVFTNNLGQRVHWDCSGSPLNGAGWVNVGSGCFHRVIQ